MYFNTSFVCVALQGSSMTASIVTGESLSELRGVVECEHPNRFLYEFVGNIRIGTKR